MLCTDMALCQERAGATYAEPLRCNSWQCEYCAPRRKKRLIAECLSGKPNTFITLTVNPAEYSDRHERARELKRAWTVVRRALARTYGFKKMPFLAVFEATKKGEPHLHIVARVKWIPQKWLSDYMNRLIGAPVVSIERIHNKKKMVNYVAKYIGKDPQRFEGTKRYWKSQNFVIDDQRQKDAVMDAESPFYVMNNTVGKLLNRAGLEGWRVSEHGKGFLIFHGLAGPPGSTSWAWGYR